MNIFITCPTEPPNIFAKIKPFTIKSVIPPDPNPKALVTPPIVSNTPANTSMIADKGPPTKSENIPFNFSTVSLNFSCALLASNCLAKSSSPANLASWAKASMFSFLSKTSDNPSAVIPTDFANASCCKTFILVKSPKSPTFLFISLVKVS